VFAKVLMASAVTMLALSGAYDVPAGALQLAIGSPLHSTIRTETVVFRDGKFWIGSELVGDARALICTVADRRIDEVMLIIEDCSEGEPSLDLRTHAAVVQTDV